MQTEVNETNTQVEPQETGMKVEESNLPKITTIATYRFEKVEDVVNAIKVMAIPNIDLDSIHTYPVIMILSKKEDVSGYFVTLFGDKPFTVPNLTVFKRISDEVDAAVNWSDISGNFWYPKVGETCIFENVVEGTETKSFTISTFVGEEVIDEDGVSTSRWGAADGKLYDRITEYNVRNLEIINLNLTGE